MKKPPSQAAKAPDQETKGWTPPDGDYDESDFKQQLSDEYKILQDKIDKIGAFRFTIKGWSITAVLAAIATTSEKPLSVVFLVSLVLGAILLLFFLLEYEQVQQSRLFGDRAVRLERTLMRLRRGKGSEDYKTFPAPYTAHELVRAGLRRLDEKKSLVALAKKLLTQERRTLKQADGRFYFTLFILALAPLLLKIHAIWDHLRNLMLGAAHLLSTLLLAFSHFCSRF